MNNIIDVKTEPLKLLHKYGKNERFFYHNYSIQPFENNNKKIFIRCIGILVISFIFYATFHKVASKPLFKY